MILIDVIFEKLNAGPVIQSFLPLIGSIRLSFLEVKMKLLLVRRLMKTHLRLLKSHGRKFEFILCLFSLVYTLSNKQTIFAETRLIPSLGGGRIYGFATKHVLIHSFLSWAASMKGTMSREHRGSCEYIRHVYPSSHSCC